MKTRGIFLYFTGLEEATVVRGSGKSRTTYHEKHFLANEERQLWTQEADGPNPDHIGPCQETFSFEFQIPEGTHPSLGHPWPYPNPARVMEKQLPSRINHMGQGGIIRWYVKAKVDRPLAIDPKDKFFFQVLSPAQSVPPTKEHTANNAHKPQKPQIVVQVDKVAYGPGEWVSGTVKFDNQTTKEIREAVVDLEYVYSYTARGHTDKFAQPVDRLEITENIFEQEWNFKLRLPDGGPPTIAGRLVQVMWQIDVKLDVVHARDSHVRVPITVYPA